MPFRVLIVDDSEAVRSEIKTHLQSLDIEIVEAQNGVEALKVFTSEPADVVLCDVQMPVMDGFQFLRMLRSNQNYESTAVIMLTGRDDPQEKVFGLENGATDYVTKPFVAGELAARVKVQLKLKSLQDDLRKMGEKFRELSITDHLTGLHNRRHFSELGELEVRRSHRYKLKCSALMLDIDHFKRVNDTHGHHVGDMVLVDFAQTIRSAFRVTDFVARFGGEEFVLLLPQTAIQEAKVAGEKLRKTLKRTALGGLSAGEVTCSIGIAEYPTDKIDGLTALLARADQALYRAKASGRDRVVLDDDKA